MEWFRGLLAGQPPAQPAGLLSDPTMSNPVGWSSLYPPQVLTNRSPYVSDVARGGLMTNEQKLGNMWRIAQGQSRGPATERDLPALTAAGGEAFDAAMGWAGMTTPTIKAPIKAFHTTYEPFEKYDWTRLGQVTQENAGGMSHETWASNLAKIGPWASEKSLMKELGGKVALPVEIGGKAKTYASLDALERAARKAGGPDAFRQSLVEGGYGHIAVKDAEFGGRSFIALMPENFKVMK